MKFMLRYLSKPRILRRIRIKGYINLATTILITPDGYLKLIEIIQHSPWFNSPKPSDEYELSVWENRVALLDLIFMNHLSA